MIREAQPQDVADIIELLRGLAHQESSIDDVTISEETLHGALFGKFPELGAYVAVDGDGVVGCALWHTMYVPWTGVRAMWLADLFVLPECRKQGHGVALMQALAGRSIKEGYCRIEWRMIESNHPASQFYKSIGASVPRSHVTWSLMPDAIVELAR